MRNSSARIAACALLLAACSRSKPAPAPEAPHHARLLAVDGDVRVKRSSSSDYAAAAKDQILDIGDIVSTGASGHATVSFDDGSTAMVTPHSLVAIEPPAASAADGLSVQSGRVDIEVAAARAGQFRIRTPDSEAAVPARSIDVVGTP